MGMRNGRCEYEFIYNDIRVSPKGCIKFVMPYILQLVIWVWLNAAADNQTESESRQQQLYTNEEHSDI